ncbi:MAG: 5-dehydro-2-deoxygluconokinase [Acidobacteria bacterium]|nr:5-dehydro-2-deoxygluconokinase [Acidobacteriota bacterium]MBI3427616.1 5-dehydro-2-deoxygluconokinase [Acidobacteriota bacterium]
MSQHKFDILCMGRALLDLYANEVGVPFAEVQNFAAYVGGCPANICVSARRLGLRAAMLSAVGDDLVGDFVLNFMQQEGVVTDFITRKPGHRTSAAVVSIQPPDKFPLVYYRDNCADIELTIDDVLAAPLAASRALLLSGTGLSREPSRSATLCAAELAKQAGTTVFLDLDLRANQWHDARAYGVTVRSALRLVDVVIGTEDEIKAAMLIQAANFSVTQTHVADTHLQGDVQAAIAALLAAGPSVVALKRGAERTTVFTRDSTVDAAAFPVEIYNTLGAGDAFAGGFIYGYLQGWDWQRAARMGNACGAIVVTRHGCSKFMPYEQEALDFIASHGGF